MIAYLNLYNIFMFRYDSLFHLSRGSNSFSVRFASITILLRPHGGLFNNNL
jgi:hypothetical protein